MRHFCEECRCFDDLSAVLRHGHVGRGGFRCGGGGCLRTQRSQQRELSVELVELDGERQEVAAAECAAAAQFLQRIFHEARGALEAGEFERGGVAPHSIDLIERLFELVAERLGFAGRLFQHLVDGVHGGVGSMQERIEACRSPLQDTAQHLALGLHLGAQIFEFANLLHARGDVAHRHQPRTRLARQLDGAEFESIVRGREAAIGVGQPHFEVLQRVRLRRGGGGGGGVRGAVVRGRCFEQLGDEGSCHAQVFCRDHRADQFLKGQIGEVLAPKQRGERARYLRQDLALAVEHEQSVHAALQNGFGQPVVCAEQLLLLALMAFDRNEHGSTGCQTPTAGGLMAVTACAGPSWMVRLRVSRLRRASHRGLAR